MVLKHWWLAIRPKTLPAALCPVIVGAACAFRAQAFSPAVLAAALTGTLLLQIGVNLANDYFDFKHHIDGSDRKGPVRVTQSGLIRPETVRNAFILTLGISLLPGLYLVFRGGPVILAVVVASLVCAVCYSGGPYPIASNGLGEVFVFIFFGPVAVCGTDYLMAGHFSLLSLLAAVPVGFLVTAIIVVNNLRDMETDARAGKRTLAVMLGQTGTRIEYVALILFAFLIPCLMFASGAFGAPVLLPLFFFPLTVPLIRTMFREKGSVLNACLAATARLALLFSFSFAAGLAWG